MIPANMFLRNSACDAGRSKCTTLAPGRRYVLRQRSRVTFAQRAENIRCDPADELTLDEGVAIGHRNCLSAGKRFPAAR